MVTSFGAFPGVKTTADLTTHQVAAWESAQAARTGSVNTLISRLRCLKTASLYAVAEGWLARPPQWRRLMPRRGPSGSVRHYSFEQVCAVLGHLESSARDWKGRRLHALAVTVAHTGLRRNEALHLQRVDVRLELGLLLVVPRRRLKTVASAAPVPIAAGLAAVLEAWLREPCPVPACPWVFPGARGLGPWHDGSPGYRPSDALRAAGEAAGVPGFTFHGLRHTLAKLLVGKFGGTAEHARSLLRHTTTRTTEEHYLHRDDPAMLAAIAAMIAF